MSMNDPNRYITLRDLDDYQIQIEAMLDVDDLMSLILKYTDEITTILFLKDLRTLRGLFSRTARTHLIEKMYVKYITTASAYQLNIPHDILRRLEGSNTSDITIFDNLEIHVLISLREQYLSDILTSDVFKNYITKKKLSFLSNIGYLKLNCLFQYMRTIYSMKRDTFDYTDFNFIRSISEDNNSYIQGTSSSHYISKLRYNILGSNDKRTSHSIHKYKIRINANVHECIDKIASITIHDPHIISQSLVDYVPFDILEDHIRYSSRTMREIYDIPQFKRREVIVLESGAKFKDNSYVIIRRSIRHNLCPINLRVHTFGGWYLKPISSNYTLITRITYWETKHCLLDMYYRESKHYWDTLNDIIKYVFVKDEIQIEEYNSNTHTTLKSIIMDNKL